MLFRSFPTIVSNYVIDHLNAELPCLRQEKDKRVREIAQVKCTLLFMFPIQHKVPSPLAESYTHLPGYRIADFSRFNLYKLGALEEDFTKARVPNRLSGRPFELVRNLMKNNVRCPYGALLNKYCPNKHERASVEITKRILSQRQGEWADQTTQFLKQHDMPSTEISSSNITFSQISDRSFAASQWEEMKKVDLSSDFQEVFQFCKSVFRHVIPKDLIGTPKNWSHLFDCIAKFIRLRRYEDLRLSYVAEHMSIPEIWTERGGHGQSHFYKCRELHLEFLYWLFNSFLVPLLRSHFYATEVSGGANRIVYYRHDVWVALTEPAFDEFKSLSLQPILRKKARELVHKSQIGTPSSLRFIPKPGGGYRGIVCLGRSREQTVYDPRTRSSVCVPQKSVNDLLKNVFSALSFEHWYSGREHIGGAITSVRELQCRLLEFKQRLPVSRQGLPKLYFAKVDIKKCYDTIPADVAFELAEKLLKNGRTGNFNFYFMHRFQRLHCKADTEMIRTKYMRLPEYAVTSAKFQAARQAAGRTNMSTAMMSMNPNTKVFVDLANGDICDGENLSILLKEHLKQNLIRVGKTVYVQDVGIPQGSILSTLLCNIVYAELEKKIFPETGENLPLHLLVRFVDDFLIISPNRSLVELFLTRMSGGFPEFGAFIHKDKTLTNFKPRKFNDELSNGLPNYRDVTTLKQTESNNSIIMPYIGLGINTRTLEIVKMPVITDTSNVSHADSVSVRANGATLALTNFRASITRLVKMKLSLPMVNLDLNSWPTVLKNIELVAKEVGNRILLGTSLWLRKNSRFSSRVIMGILKEVLALMVERTRVQNLKTFVHAREHDIINLTARAILQVFTKAKRHKLATCINYLETLIS